MPKGLNPFDKQEMLRAIRAKEEEKKNLVGPSDENLNQNKSQEAKEDTQEVSPAEKHKRFRSMVLGHSKVRTRSEICQALFRLLQSVTIDFFGGFQIEF